MKGDLMAVLSYLMGGSREEGVRLLLEVCKDQARDDEHKLEHRRFQLDCRKTFSLQETRTGTGEGKGSHPWSKIPSGQGCE